MTKPLAFIIEDDPQLGEIYSLTLQPEFDTETFMDGDVAIERLSHAGRMKAVSALYETEPVEVVDQPWFLNCVAAIETDLSPRALLDFALALEHDMGRLRTQDKGPRVIDIDILLFGARVITEPGLAIPHPAMQDRRFVLAPIAEIAPNLQHPVLKRSVSQMLAALPPGQRISKADLTLGS